MVTKSQNSHFKLKLGIIIFILLAAIGTILGLYFGGFFDPVSPPPPPPPPTSFPKSIQGTWYERALDIGPGHIIIDEKKIQRKEHDQMPDYLVWNFVSK